jgi:hypothetical protein
MAEHRSKAAFAREHLIESAASREEREQPKRPQLQLRRDAPSIEVGNATRITEALHELKTERIGTLALREPDGRPQAVILSVERYLELATREVENAPAVVSKGLEWVSDDALKTSHVEQVDPSEPWGVMAPHLT